MPWSSGLAYTVAGPHPHARARAGPAAPPCARPPTTPAAAATPARAWAAADSSGAAVVAAAGPPHRSAGRGDPHQRGQLLDGLVDHLGSPSLGGALSVASCSNSAERFPWNSITVRALVELSGQALVLPAQPGVLPLHRINRRPARGRPPTPGARLGHATCAIRRSARCTAPRGAAARPCRPCPAARTRPGSRPCSGPSSCGAAWPARDLRVRSLVHGISMRHHGGHARRLLPALSAQ
jgi:hypothetical protein